MFSINMRRIYQRLSILGLLLMCLFYFGYSDRTESVSATAICVQDCEASEARCNDSCATSCSADSTDEECNSCVQSCNTRFESCMKNAVICSSGTGASYTPSCQVIFSKHCPYISGIQDCTGAAEVHYGYSTDCKTLGEQRCVACPDHEFCEGSYGLPPCY